MRFSIANRALLRGMVAGTAVLAGAMACSRSDRTERSGRDNTAAVLPDTANVGATQARMADTMSGISGDTTGVAAQTTPAPRAETATPPPAAGGDTTLQAEGEGAAGYRGMERDTSTPPSDENDTARVSQDTSANAGIDTSAMAGETPAAAEVGADTAAGYNQMARDTSTTLEQADTVAQAEGEVAIQANVDTARVDPGVTAEADVTADASVPVETSDTVVVVGDSAHMARTGERLEAAAASPEANDTLRVAAEAEPIRPPEDSTEVLGNVTEAEQIRAPEDSTEVATADVEVDVDAEAQSDEVGAAAIPGGLTGVEAVALMSRQGATCTVLDPESDEEVRWDMSSTPVTLNPCGLGSMVLSRLWTEW